MNKHCILLALGLASLLGGCRNAPPPASGTVKALRYRVFWAASTLEAMHGGGGFVEELYFPDRKFGCTLVSDVPWDGITFSVAPRLHPFFAHKPRNDLTGFHGAPPSKITEVEVPKALADRIFAEAKRRLKDRNDAIALGREVIATGTMKLIDLLARTRT